ncbi:3-phosphoglycerate dehydrogenase [Polaribacter reichenbachii]|uniref:3-phosphoglycerate dehydrogenase n=1 Tax=Polaribacter reichenbachii TaxID=996801 RepID=A0A1B8TZW0_9FLAO|nr:D-2-hydroxyacid dehydrogenase [Polaribacter reichenbachii]APZ47180.1 3-phosphoglycerate dehydrogenase [Polaribacter reichenbachii]AUC17820.1 3-phosphoglycerate dehydrogenase [Polaribacter reichenbachii]OBY65156.1 3-phosphoglycerate dehydrogenase [Polaribacter reichenbachii]
MKILANDGISKSGIDALEKGGFEVLTTKVAQSQLENYINEHNIDAILVRSATQVRQELIDACPSLKLIGRGGVGMDNIDVDYAIDNGLHVINTPAASSSSVAELVFSHLFGMVRFLHSSNREMPLEGDTRFKELKKAYAQGTELRGKTLGIIGFGRIGQEVAKIGIGLGMNVIATDELVEDAAITLDFFNGQKISFQINTIDKDELLKESDFITLHVPAQEDYIISEAEFEKMKDGVGIVNAARGGILNEVDLVKAIESGKVQFAGLDVFETEPTPAVQLLMNTEISLTPHIGAATKEAQDRIGLELAKQIVELLR